MIPAKHGHDLQVCGLFNPKHMWDVCKHEVDNLKLVIILWEWQKAHGMGISGAEMAWNV